MKVRVIYTCIHAYIYIYMCVCVYIWKLVCIRIYIGNYCARTLSLSLILSLFLSYFFSRAFSLFWEEGILITLVSKIFRYFLAGQGRTGEYLSAKEVGFVCILYIYTYMYIYVHFTCLCIYEYLIFAHICMYLYVHIHTHIHTHTCRAFSAIEIGFGNALTIERVLHWPPHICMYII